MSVPKICEGCGRGMLIDAPPLQPLAAKLSPKYCKSCKPIMGYANKPLPDCSKLVDPLPMNTIQVSEVNREWGRDLSRRQIKQLAWVNGFRSHG